MNKISIIIPVLNEENGIAKLLVHLKEASTSSNISDIILVDGGSDDGTQDKVNQYISSIIAERSQQGFDCTNPEIKLLHSEKGRAKQMNLGAQYAKGAILYFLHADSFPPKHFDQLIISEVNNGHQAGCFRLKFDSNHWWLRLASWLTQFRWRACRGGDQSQFITKELFNDIGGFDERFIIYEDNILINELYSRNEFVVINKQINTSARLYRKHGVWRLQYHFWTIYVKKWFGASADDLFDYYKRNIC